MRTDELDFHLPPELIAQLPTGRRDEARLLHYRRQTREIEHRRVCDLPDLLRRGDLLVFNDARVVPARFALRKPTGGRIEGLFLAQREQGRWHVLLRNAGPRVTAEPLAFEGDSLLHARVVERGQAGEFVIELTTDEPAAQVLARLGRMPLPPYIRRDKTQDARDELDRERYQTVYAAAEGSVAAPTAGLHFTPELLAQLDGRGVERVSVTLDVGLGTFKPVTVDRIEDHPMHVESYRIAAAAAAAVNRAQSEGRRIVAVGTTSARVLESQPAGSPIKPGCAETGILIHPPYAWKYVGALLTNFHLPRSTLIALVAAMTGLEEQRRLYQTAIEQRYRFFSYGDAMLIE